MAKRGRHNVARIALLAILGTAAFAHPEIDELIEQLNDKIAQDPHNYGLYLRRGELHRIDEHWLEAETDLIRAAELSEGALDIGIYLGRLQLESGHAPEAVRSLDAFLDHHPHNRNAYALRARAHSEAGDPLGAAADWQRAIEADATGTAGPTYYLERAKALEAAGAERAEEALRALDEGIAVHGAPMNLLLFAIDLHVRLGQWDAALDRLEAVAARSRRLEIWLLRRGEILEAAGATEEALAAYRATLEAVGSLGRGRQASRSTQQIVTAARTGIDRLLSATGTGSVPAAPVDGAAGTPGC